MTDLSLIIGANVLQRGKQGVETHIAMYGDPGEHQRRRLIGVDAVLDAAGVYGGKRIDQRVLAALDLQMMTMGLLSSHDPVAVLGDGIAVLAHLARALGEEADSAADEDGAKRLAKRYLVPAAGEPPAAA